jgi:hypothetical protein
MAQIDRLLVTALPAQLERQLSALKEEIDRANTSTICDKRELDVPLGWLPFNVLELTKLGANEIWNMVWRRDGYARS